MMKFHALALSSLAVALVATAQAGVIEKAQRDAQAAATGETWGKNRGPKTVAAAVP